MGFAINASVGLVSMSFTTDGDAGPEIVETYVKCLTNGVSSISLSLAERKVDGGLLDMVDFEQRLAIDPCLGDEPASDEGDDPQEVML